jgi:hypothetical protein
LVTGRSPCSIKRCSVIEGIYLTRRGCCRGPIHSFRTEPEVGQIDPAEADLLVSTACTECPEEGRESLRAQDDRVFEQRIGLVPDMVVRPSRTASTRFTNCSSQRHRVPQRTIHHFCRRPPNRLQASHLCDFSVLANDRVQPRGSLTLNVRRAKCAKKYSIGRTREESNSVDSTGIDEDRPFRLSLVRRALSYPLSPW